MNLEKLGFASNWKSEEIYQALKKIQEQLNQQQQDRIMNHEVLIGKINKKDLQKKWWEGHDIISSPFNKVFPLNIS